jgi:hypothetical protein
MLAFRDFAPRSVSPPSWGSVAGVWETLGEALAVANEWIQSERVDVVNVETIVFPCHVDTPTFAQTDAPASRINGQHWHIHKQFIRVWYRTREPPQQSSADGERAAAEGTSDVRSRHQ